MEYRLVTTIPYSIYVLGIILATIFVPSILVRDKKTLSERYLRTWKGATGICILKPDTSATSNAESWELGYCYTLQCTSSNEIILYCPSSLTSVAGKIS